jgi:hypothetical protein
MKGKSDKVRFLDVTGEIPREKIDEAIGRVWRDDNAPEFEPNRMTQDCNEPKNFVGHLEGFDVLEYLQLILLSGKQTVVEVHSPQGEVCRLFCRDGQIVHASMGQIQGETAFFECVCFQGGTITNLPWEIPAEESINKPGDYLLMEAARRKDEGKT